MTLCHILLERRGWVNMTTPFKTSPTSLLFLRPLKPQNSLFVLSNFATPFKTSPTSLLLPKRRGWVNMTTPFKTSPTSLLPFCPLQPHYSLFVLSNLSILVCSQSLFDPHPFTLAVQNKNGTCGKVTFKTPIPPRSAKLNNIEPAQHLNGDLDITIAESK